MFGGSPYGRGGNGNHEAYNYINAITSTATPPLNCIPPGDREKVVDVLRPDLLRGLSSIHFPSDPLY
jgi:hypothetical protein